MRVLDMYDYMLQVFTFLRVLESICDENFKTMPKRSVDIRF